MFVKICGITNEEDALLSIAVGADALGFNFVNGSKRKIATQRAAEIARRLPPDVLTVTVDLRDICDAKIMGADCVLLIVAALEKKLLAEFIEFCEDLNLAALVETHDEAEVEIALDSGAKMIGINQRDLKTFKVDQKRALRVVSEIPEDIIRVAESGIRALSDAKPLKTAGFDAVLIGESLVMSDFPEELVTQLRNL